MIKEEFMKLFADGYLKHMNIHRGAINVYDIKQQLIGINWFVKSIQLNNGGFIDSLSFCAELFCYIEKVKADRAHEDILKGCGNNS